MLKVKTTGNRSAFDFKLRIFLLYKHNLEFWAKLKDVIRLVKKHLLRPYKNEFWTSVIKKKCFYCLKFRSL